jgi:hypothetical protein
MKETAVEWLIEQIENGKIEIIYSDKIHSIKCLPEFIKQAKEMEKEQIIEAYNKNKMGRFEYGEYYYKETYGK